MTNLLLDEPPLIVLPQLAKLIGLNESIVLQQLHYWLQKSNNNEDGYTWVYNSYPKWQEQFPFWGIDTIKRVLTRLEKNGLVISGAYNKYAFDKTKWYRIDYDKFALTMRAICTDDEGNLHRPIPETTTETTTKINDTNVSLSNDPLLDNSLSPKSKVNPDVESLIDNFEIAFGLKLKRVTAQRRAAFNLVRRYGLERAKQGVLAAVAVRAQEYAPQIINLEDLWDKWDKLALFYEKKNQKQSQRVVIIPKD